MSLTVILGATVDALLEGHSAINGAPIPEGATIALTSNDPLVATVPATVPVPTGGAQSFVIPVTVLAVGSTDFHVMVTDADGTFEATATLLVTPLPSPGLVSVTLTLRSPAGG